MIRAEIKFDFETIKQTAAEKVRSRLKILQLLPWFGGAVLIFAIISWIVNPITADFAWGIVIGLLLLISKKVTLWVVIKDAKKKIGDRTYSVWIFSAEGIHVSGDGFDTKLEWKNVENIQFYDRIVGIEFSGLDKSYIPKAAFGNEEAIVDLRKLWESKRTERIVG